MIGLLLNPGIPGTRCTRYPPHSGGGNYSFVFLLYLSMWLELFDGFRGFRGLNVPCGTILIPRNKPQVVYILPVASVWPCIVRIQKLTISRGRGGGHIVPVHIGESMSCFYQGYQIADSTA